MQTVRALCLVVTALAAVLAAGTAGTAAELERCARLVSEGDQLMRTGNFFGASEVYREAVLTEPADGGSRLRFATALLALGRYDYASFSLRRGVAALGYPDDLWMDVPASFPHRRAYDRSVRDLRVYLRHYPGDPHGLSVLAFAQFMTGDMRSAQLSCRELLRCNRRDDLAAYLLRRIELVQSPPWGAPDDSSLADGDREETDEAWPVVPEDPMRPDQTPEALATAPPEEPAPAADDGQLGELRGEGRRSAEAGSLTEPETRPVIAK